MNRPIRFPFTVLGGSYIFEKGDSTESNEKLKTKSDIDTIFRQAQGGYNAWCKLPEKQRTTQELLSKLDFDFFELLRLSIKN